MRRAAFLPLPMIYAITALLVFQLIGELIVRTLGLPLPGALAGMLLLFAGLLLLGWFYAALPKKLFTTPTSYVLEDARGELLSAAIAADGQWRFPYNKKLPAHFVDCITTFEDKRFFKHPGVDGIAFLRAAIANAGGKATQGGSTLSMQVIRLSQKNNGRTIFNKIKESMLALRLELSYSKKQWHQ